MEKIKGRALRLEECQIHEEREIVRSILSDFNGVRLGFIKTNDEEYMIVIYSVFGEKIIIPCQNFEEASAATEKIMLNLEKVRIERENGDRYGIISATQGEQVEVQISRPNIRYMHNRRKIENDLYKQLYETYGLEYDDGKIISKDALRKYNDETLQGAIKLYFKRKAEAKIGTNVNLEDSTADQIIKKILLITRSEEQHYILTSLEQVRIDGEPLERTRTVGQYLIDQARTQEENAVDFNKYGYSEGVQNYLLKLIYNQQINITDEQKEGLVKFKRSGYKMINSLMRGDYETIEREYTRSTSIALTVRQILQMETIAKALPKRNCDIIVSRLGRALHNSQSGSENKKQYKSFVSFGTNNGTWVDGTSSETKVLYRRLLKGGEPAIPIDLICPEALSYLLLECEILNLPMSYDEINVTETEDYLGKGVSKIIEMGNIENIPVHDIIKKRLNEIRRLLEKTPKTTPQSEEESPERLETDEDRRKYEIWGYIDNPEDEQLELADIMEQYRKSGEMKEIIGFDERIIKDPMQYKSELHGAPHTRRVAFLVRTLANLYQLPENDKRLLLFAAQNHGIGREHDMEDIEHGQKSAYKLKDAEGWTEFSPEEQELISFIITQHSEEKNSQIQAISRLGDDKKERYKMMLNYLTDADKLDRVRLGRSDGLDPSRLTLPISKKMVKMAYQTKQFLFKVFEYEESESKIRRMLEDVNAAIKLIEQIEQSPMEEVIEVNPLIYFDDYKQNRISAPIPSHQDENIR